MTFAWCLQVDHCTSGLGFSFGPKNCGWFFLRNTARLSRNPSASSTSIWVFALKQASCQRNVTFPKLLCLDLFLSEALTRRQRFETRRATRNDDVSNKSASNIKEGMSQLEIITMTTANKLLHKYFFDLVVDAASWLLWSGLLQLWSGQDWRGKLLNWIKRPFSYIFLYFGCFIFSSFCAKCKVITGL